MLASAAEKPPYSGIVYPRNKPTTRGIHPRPLSLGAPTAPPAFVGGSPNLQNGRRAAKHQTQPRTSTTKINKPTTQGIHPRPEMQPLSWGCPIAPPAFVGVTPNLLNGKRAAKHQTQSRTEVSIWRPASNNQRTVEKPSQFRNTNLPKTIDTQRQVHGAHNPIMPPTPLSPSAKLRHEHYKQMLRLKAANSPTSNRLTKTE